LILQLGFNLQNPRNSIGGRRSKESEIGMDAEGKNCNRTRHNKHSCRSALVLHRRAQGQQDLQEAYKYLEELEAEQQSESEEERVTAYIE
jgi:hypothetical protein